MRPIWAIAAFLALVCAACTSASGGTTPSGSAPRTMTAPHTTVPTTTAPSVSSGSGFSGPPRPVQPTIPADVPRTGPNTKRGEKPPLMPLEATQHTPEGAKAFAAFFIKTIDWGFAVVSGSYPAHYSAASCTSCTVFVSGLNKARRLNHRYIGGRITITKVDLARKPLVTAAEFTGVVTFNVQSFEELTRTGKVVQADGAHSGERFEVSLAWLGRGWDVVKLAADA